jgi:anti-sigma regulatory factor (Ser/Thr protein kinase)
MEARPRGTATCGHDKPDMADALSLALPPDLTSPGVARQSTRECLGPVLDAGDVELAVLIVSELVTNAVLHAGTPCEVSVRTADGLLRVEVHDGDTRPPVRRLSPSDSVATGRGVRMLQSLGERWGVETDECGKTVWWELRLST